MQSSRKIVSVVLLVTGLAFCAANGWYTYARSLIPLAIDATVKSKEKRREKHPGIDDVYLITLSDGRTLVVDQQVYEVMSIGSRINKRSGETYRYDQTHSRDTMGMRLVMPIAALVLCVLAGTATSRPAEESIDDEDAED